MGRFISIVSLSFLLILCHSASAVAQPPNLGFYFDAEGNQTEGMPPTYTVFDAYLILKDAPYEVTGVEFQLLTSIDPSHALLLIVDFSFPQENTLWIGDPFSGMSIVYWPPLDGFTNDHLLLCTLQCLLFEPCGCDGGTIWDYPIVVGPHPETGELWAAEHAPQGGDEVNIVLPGHNYGWPVVSYGREYSGPRVTQRWHQEGFDVPVVVWLPSVAPSGIMFYTGDRFPGWAGDLFVGALRVGRVLRTGHIERVILNDDGEEVGREAILTELRQRIRDIKQGPDGHIYALTDEEDGVLMRIEPVD